MNAINWDKYTYLFGEMTDRSLARLIGCHQSTVTRHRREYGIPGCPGSRQGPMPRYSWEDVDHLLGTMEDRRIAEMLGCSRDAVTRRRRNLKIPAFRRRAPYKTQIDWEYWDQFLETENLLSLSKRIGCTYQAVLQRKRWK